MMVKRGIIIGMSLLLLTGMRDPFRPPEDRCQIAELTQWHYRGMVGQGERVIAIISDSQHKWQPWNSEMCWKTAGRFYR